MTARLKYWIKRLVLRALGTVPGRADEIAVKLDYALEEIATLHQVVRVLTAESAAFQRYSDQTRHSFDYQWANLTESPHLHGGAVFDDQAGSLLTTYTGFPIDWFRGKRILDAGCGNGRWSWALCRAGAEVTAVDVSEAGVAAVRSACAEFQGFTAHRHNLLEPLDQGLFDLVWSFGVIHHTGDTRRALTNIAAAVRPGGYIYLMIYGEPRPDHVEDYTELAGYMRLRRELAPLSFDDKVAYLRKHTGVDDVHGWFDAASPLINDLHHFEEIAGWLRDLGFVDIHEVGSSRNFHLVGRRS